MNVSESQMTALRNLARKQAGDDVDWINIADARALTDLGLAERGRVGWIITEAGKRVVATQAATIHQVRPQGPENPGER